MKIDYEILKEYADLFRERAIKGNQYLAQWFPEQTKYDFSVKSDFKKGFLWYEEGYKYSAKNKMQGLYTVGWNENGRNAEIIFQDFKELIYDRNLGNLIDWRDKDKLIKTYNDESKQVILSSCIYDIYCKDNDNVSFTNVQNCIGGKFPIISYLFFIKDPANYLPVRPDSFKKRFQSIGVTGWNNRCSWKNYMDFISAIKEIQRFLINYYKDETISLIDAHSFVWMANLIKMSEEDFLDEIKKSFSKDLKNDSKKKKEDMEIKQIESGLEGVKGEEKKTLIKVRVNQGIFKKYLLNRYAHCCLCAVSNKDFLWASHIKPWAESMDDEKLDKDNGFLLCPNHDRLFDKGYISFDDDGKIMISAKLNKKDMSLMNVKPDMTIKLYIGNRRYLQYHRSHIFKREHATQQNRTVVTAQTERASR